MTALHTLGILSSRFTWNDFPRVLKEFPHMLSTCWLLFLHFAVKLIPNHLNWFEVGVWKYVCGCRGRGGGVCTMKKDLEHLTLKNIRKSKQQLMNQWENNEARVPLRVKVISSVNQLQKGEAYTLVEEDLRFERTAMRCSPCRLHYSV